VPRRQASARAARNRGRAGRLERAQAFKALASADRPVEAFTSLREARQWLMKQPVVDP